MSGTDPAQRIADAEQQAALAKHRLGQTVSALQVKLNPRRLAQQAMRDAADRGGAAAMTGAEAVRRNPGAAAGVAAAAVLFLARHKVARLFRRRRKVPMGKVQPQVPLTASDDGSDLS
ncbi:Protein of unknown function [Sphingomonas gellani]|uniref:DUF3618 domain-containing protein n=1 Tax=Sphingomonas gellani TaxID=1166340 RepID=A0A1H8EK94_9SPHN|nr:DUF3618 domain-containing protein [Sphingomonas gellani]SEN19991.1 Protein of unknown function [Sphingomonas gellani]